MNRFNLSASFVFLSFAIAGLLVATGCNKNGGTTGSQSPNASAMIPGPQQTNIAEKLPGDAKYAEGKRVFATKGCAGCHKVGEVGGGRAPNLASVAKNPEHTKDWLATHIRNPRAHNPKSRMRAYDPNQIDDEQLNALTDYLSSLK